MKVVLYSLPDDQRKANAIAVSTNNTFNIRVQAGGDGVAIQMTFLKIGGVDSPRYELDEETKMAVAASVGLFGTIDSLVIMMHAAAGKLSPQGAMCGGNPIVGHVAWSLDNLSQLMRGWAAPAYYFLCCKFGAAWGGALNAPYRVADGPAYLAQRQVGGTRIFAMSENVMAIGGMPVLAPDYYTRRLTA